MPRMRTVRLLETEDYSLVRAARFRGQSENDFIYDAVMAHINVARLDRRAGVPSATRVERRPPREGLRRKTLSVMLTPILIRLVDAQAEVQSDYSKIIRHAIANEIAYPSTSREEPTPGLKEHPATCAMTDAEMDALTIAATERGIKRSKFVRIAIFNALSTPIANAVDTASTTPRGTSLPSRQAVELDHSRPDTTVAQ